MWILTKCQENLAFLMYFSFHVGFFIRTMQFLYYQLAFFQLFDEFENY